MRPRPLRGLALLLVWLWGASFAAGQLPEPRLTSVFPAGARVGTTGLEISLAGENLDEALGLTFSHPGIQGKPVMSDPTPLSGKTWALSGRHVIDVDAGVPPGIYALRFRGRFGVSNPVSFEVGDREEVLEGGAHHSAETAMPLAVGVVVNGRAAEGRADFFRLSAKAGETLRIRCVAGDIDSRMQPDVVVFDASGKRELARASVAAVREARLDFEAAQDGEVIVRIADYLGSGGGEYVYRMSASTGPEPGVAPAGRPGDEAFPRVRKDSTSAEPLRVTPPCVVEGMWNPAAATERFVIDAVAGQALVAEIFSERLGHATDPVIAVERREPVPEGEATRVPVGRFDDLGQGGGKARLPLASRDAVAPFTAEKGGEYHLAIADQFGGGGEPTPYLLRVAEPRPDFELVAVATIPVVENKQVVPGPTVLRSGGTLAIEVHALRRDGFDGAIALRFEGLPDEVVAENAEIPAGRLETLVVLRAGVVSGRRDGGFRIVGVGDPGERVARVMRLRRSVGDHDREEVRYAAGEEFGFALLPEESPLRVAVKEGTSTAFETSLGGTVQIPIVLSRQEGFKGNVRIRPEGIAGMNQAAEVQLDEKTGEGVLSIAFVNRDNNRYAPGPMVFRLIADGTLSYEPNREAKMLAEAEKQEAEMRATELAAQATAAPGNEELAGQARKAEEEKTRLTERAAQAAERSKARDVRVFAHSVPLTVQLAASPVRIAEVAMPTAVVAGSESVLKVTVARDYGFAEAVRIEAALPEESGKVLRVEPVTVAADLTEVEMKIVAVPGGAEGNYPLQLKAKLQFNGMDLEATRDIVVTLQPQATP